MLNNNHGNYNQPLSQQEVERRLAGVDKAAVEKKLRQMGMKDVADKLSKTSNQDIMNMLRNNPDIIKRVNQLMGGGNGGR